SFSRRARWSAIAITWREERPDATTAASQSEERPARLMVTISSALSSSSEATMRLSKRVCSACLGISVFGAAGFFLVPAFFLAAGFLPAGFFDWAPPRAWFDWAPPRPGGFLAAAAFFLTAFRFHPPVKAAGLACRMRRRQTGATRWRFGDCAHRPRP